MVHHLAILLISFIVVCTLAQSASSPSVNSDLLELDQTSDPSNTSTPDPSSSLLPTTTPPSSTPTDQTSPPPTSPEASRIIIVVAGTTGALTTGTSPPTVPPYERWVITVLTTSCLRVNATFTTWASWISLPATRLLLLTYPGCPILTKRTNVLKFYIFLDDDGLLSNQLTSLIFTRGGDFGVISATASIEPVPRDPPNDNKTPHLFLVITIVAAVVAGVLLLVAAFLLFFYRRYRKQQAARSSSYRHLEQPHTPTQ